MNYYNSSIAIKRKRCSSCGNPNAVIFSKGRCSYCSKKEDTAPKKTIFTIKQDNELEDFFRLAALEIARKPYCMSCGEWILEQYYRHATAHILPKKLFKSVATHPSNYLILSASCGCHDKSHVWAKFEQMNVWSIAVTKFKILYPLLLPYEHQFIPPELLKHVE